MIRSIFYSLCFVCLSACLVQGQTILNANFEDWEYNQVFGQPPTVKHWRASHYPIHTTFQSGVKNSGTFAISIYAKAVQGKPIKSQLGYGAPAYNAQRELDLTLGGMPTAERPEFFNGYYMFQPSATTADSASVSILFKKFNAQLNRADTIGFASHNFLPSTDFTQFNLPIVYRSAQIPDSVFILFTVTTQKTTEVDEGYLVIDDLSFSSPSALLENKAFSSVSVAPNPSSGMFTIKGDPSEPLINLNFKVVDFTGKEVYQSTEESLVGLGYVIDLSTFAEGIYILEMRSGKQIRHQKLIKN